MKSPFKPFHLRHVLIPILSLVIGALHSQSAHAAAPDANSVISNQAVASYIDGAGVERRVHSNSVRSRVAQVGAFELTGSNTKEGALGTTVYMQHTLINRGNGADSFNVTVLADPNADLFSQIAVYSDDNGTGIPSDPVPLCTSAGPRTCDGQGFVRQLAGQGASFPFLVAYTLPAQMPVGIQNAVAKVLAAPSNSSTSFYATYASAQLEQADTVKLTAGTVFSMTKAIGAPAQRPPQGTWPEPLSAGKASSSQCNTQWSATLLSSNPTCTYTVFTLTYSNTGTEAGDLTLQETLPDGLTYVQGSAVWSGSPGTFLSETAIAQPQGSGANQIHYGYAAVTKVLDATVLGVAPNVSGSLSFVVLINHLARPGISTSTSVANYYASSCNANLSGISAAQCGGVDPSGRPTPPAATNAVPFVVLQTYGVVAAGSISRVPDGAPVPPKSGENLVEQASVTAGGAVLFRNVITNSGNGVDAFNLSVRSDEGDTAFPSGTRFELLYEDGLTALADTNGDGLADTGPMPPSTGMTVVVRAQLPFLGALVSGPLDAILTATSVGNAGAPDPLTSDSVWNRVGNVRGSLVDLTATPAGGTVTANLDGAVSVTQCTPGMNCDVGQGPSPSPTTTDSAYPGKGAAFPFYLRNNDSSSQTYQLSAELPSGWSVKFLSGVNVRCDGAELRTPVFVEVGEQVPLSACVTPAVQAPLGLHVFRLTARSTSSVNQGHVESDSLTFAAQVLQETVRAMSVSPVQASSPVSMGGSVIQSITLTNTGNANCVVGRDAALQVTVALDADAQAAGWRTSLYYDKNADGALDASDILMPDGAASPWSLNDVLTGNAESLSPFVPARSLQFLLKTQASASASLQSGAKVTLQFVDRSEAACKIPSALYSFTAQSENIRLIKSQALDVNCEGKFDASMPLSTDVVAVAPGQCLIYQVVIHNDGVTPLNDVAVTGAVPAYTRYTDSIAGQPAVQCESSGLSGVPVSVVTQPTGGAVRSVTCGSVGNSLGSLGNVRLTFSVKVDQ